MSWNRVKLGDLLKRRKTAANIIPDKDYKLVTIKLHHKGVVLRNTVKGSELKSSMFEIKAGDFILSGIDARNGAFGIVPNELEGALITNDFWCLEPDKDIIGKEFFLFLSKTDFFDQICRLSSDGTTQRIRLQRNKFYDYEVSFPRLDKQRMILSKLNNQKTNSDTLTAELTHQIDLVKQLRQSFLREAMQGKLVEQDKKDEPASELLNKIKAEKEKLVKENKIKNGKELAPIKDDEIPFAIPNNWVWCRLGKICIKIGSGSTPRGSNYSKTGIPFYRSQNIYNEGLVLEDITYISDEVHKQMSGTIVYANDLLLNITGGSIGRCALVSSDCQEGNVSQHVCIIRPSCIDKAFLHKVILSSYFQKMVFNSTTGAGREGLPKYNLEQFLIPLPPLPEQHRIVAKLEQLMKLCDDLEQGIRQSKEQTNMLLQAALREALQPKAKVIKLPVLQEVEEKAFLKRKVLATYIINQSLNDSQFGDTKFEKLLHLADYTLKRNLNQNYIQKVAGPYDNSFTYPYFEQVEKSKWFIRKKEGSRYIFKPGQNHLKSINTYNLFSEDELNKVNRIIRYFKNSTYEKPEIVSTLYAVWNNRIIQQQEINDALLIEDFYEWDENKKRYERSVLERALQWMRKEGLVPDGWGKVIVKKAGKK